MDYNCWCSNRCFFGNVCSFFFGISNYAAPPDKIDEKVFNDAFNTVYPEHRGRPVLGADELSKQLKGKDITHESIEKAILDMKGISTHNAQIIATSYMEGISSKKNKMFLVRACHSLC